MIDYTTILSVNYSGKQWAISGSDYDAINWLDASPKPTQAELDALWPATQKAVFNKSQEDARSNAYRNESDPLFFKWQRGEGTEQEWKNKVAEIQARYPYEQLAAVK
jgi:hypothetical protein